PTIDPADNRRLLYVRYPQSFDDDRFGDLVPPHPVASVTRDSDRLHALDYTRIFEAIGFAPNESPTPAATCRRATFPVQRRGSGEMASDVQRPRPSWCLSLWISTDPSTATGHEILSQFEGRVGRQ